MRTPRVRNVQRVRWLTVANSPRRLYCVRMADVRAFGDLLRRLREAAGLVQAEAAKKAGISRNYWNQLESPDNERLPALEKILPLADAVGARPGDIREFFELAGHGAHFRRIAQVVTMIGAHEMPALEEIIVNDWSLDLDGRTHLLGALEGVRARIRLERLEYEQGIKAQDVRLMRNEEPAAGE